MKYYLNTILVLTISCAAPVEKPAAQSEAARLTAKRDLYCKLSRPMFEDRGHIVSKCDGALFAALHEIGCGFPDANRWQAESGQVFRSLERDCFGNGANAESSKDMLQGWLTRNIHFGAAEPVRKFLSFANDGGGYFCQAEDLATRVSKCLLPPTTAVLMRVFAEKAEAYTQSRINGKYTQSRIDVPEFTNHLKILRKLQKAMVYGGLSSYDVRQIRQIAEAQPNNALYQAVRGLFDEAHAMVAFDLLLDEKHWPADRLPTSANHCSDYLYQRAEDPGDWEPCPERDETYFGTDFVFAATVALRGLF